MDKNKSHFLSPEDTEEIRRLEQQELAFWRGVGFEETSWKDTRRFAGGNRGLDDGSPETQQRSRSKEEKIARGDREGIKERCPEWETMPWMVWMVLCRHEGANTDIASNIRVETT